MAEKPSWTLGGDNIADGLDGRPGTTVDERGQPVAGYGGYFVGYAAETIDLDDPRDRSLTSRELRLEANADLIRRAAKEFAGPHAPKNPKYSAKTRHVENEQYIEKTGDGLGILHVRVFTLKQNVWDIRVTEGREVQPSRSPNNTTPGGGLKDGYARTGIAAANVNSPLADLSDEELTTAERRLEATRATDAKNDELLDQLSEEERQNAWRFQEQCFLMLNWEAFTRANVSLSSNFELQPSAYTNFAQIESKDVYEFNNLLFKKAKDGHKLMHLNAAQLSSLLPEIRLWKEYPVGDDGSVHAVEIPFDDVIQNRDIKKISESGVGRGGGVGLKSFTWKSLGTNPADKYNFGAKLVLHFQNIEELFKIRSRVVTESGNVHELKYSDLILIQKKYRKGENEGSFTYDKDYYRIKAVCGWHVPVGNKLIPKDVADILSQTKTVMNLALKSHDLDFRNDGTVELTINYIAYGDTMLSDPQYSNVLYTDPKLERRKKQLAKNLDRQNAHLEKLKKQHESAGQKMSADLKKQYEESVENVEKQLNKLAAQAKEFSYQRIVAGLLKSGRIYQIPVPQDFFKKQLEISSTPRKKKYTYEDYLKSVDGTISKNAELSPNRVPASFSEESGMNKVRTSDFDDDSLFSKSLQKIDDLLVSLGFDARFRNIEKERAENRGEAYDSLVKTIKDDIQGDNYLVKWIYFGDLLEVVLDGMFSHNKENLEFPNKELKVLLGNLTFLDYGQLEDSGLVIKTGGLKNEKYEYERLYTGKRVSVNIADIPISFKVFTNWFIENITDKNLERMTFKEFMNSIVQDLLIRAVSTECREFAPKQQARMTYKTFSIPKSRKRDRLYQKAKEQKGGYRFTLEDFKGSEFKLHPTKVDQGGSEPLENYLLVYGTVEYPFDLSSDIQKDSERGIYHLFFGNEYGLVKDIKFKRDDLPGLQEANIANQLADKRGPAKILRFKYNASVEMVGNNLFEIGGKVHVTPSAFGTGAVIDRSKVLLDLGIGGYFDVNGIENSIEPGKYNTTLDVKWAARGDGTYNIGDKEYSTEKVSSLKTSMNVKTSRIL